MLRTIRGSIGARSTSRTAAALPELHHERERVRAELGDERNAELEADGRHMQPDAIKALAVRAAAAAVDRMYEVAGGTAVYRDSPLQRHFRDVHAATQHMMVGTSTYELTGRLLLGLETDTSFL